MLAVKDGHCLWCWQQARLILASTDATEPSGATHRPPPIASWDSRRACCQHSRQWPSLTASTRPHPNTACRSGVGAAILRMPCSGGRPGLPRPGSRMQLGGAVSRLLGRHLRPAAATARPGAWASRRPALRRGCHGLWFSPRRRSVSPAPAAGSGVPLPRSRARCR